MSKWRERTTSLAIFDIVMQPGQLVVEWLVRMYICMSKSFAEQKVSYYPRIDMKQTIHNYRHTTDVIPKPRYGSA